MRWDEALEAALQRLSDDGALATALTTAQGAHNPITRAGELATPALPGLTYSVTGNWLTDTEEVAFTEWRLRSTTLAGLIAIERRMRAALDRRYPEDVGGSELLMEYVNGQDAEETPGAGAYGRVVWYRITVRRDS